MTDTKSWNMCNSKKPSKKGKYLLIVGKMGLGGCLEMNVVECMWNGHIWAVPDTHRPMKWTYIRTGAIDKYPKYDMNKEVTNYDI